MAVPHTNGYLFKRPLCIAVQGGYFFMYLIISFTAVKTIAKASREITSIITQYTPPFYKGVGTTATVPLQGNYIALNL